MANEKRLIDATRLRFEANRFFRNDSKAQDDVDSLICMMPTVDAVEVGRCKGCYYYESSNPGHGYCKYFDTLRIDNDFCSSWERKSNG